MSFDNLLTLLIIGGLGYMMFRGGGCCGSHGSHGSRGDHGDSHDSGQNKEDARTGRDDDRAS